MAPYFLLLLQLSCLALAMKPPDPGLSLQERVQRLMDLSSRKPVIHMASKNFHDLVLPSPRNYSLILLFTALQSHRGCGVCAQAGVEFNLVASSYRYSNAHATNMFFALVDFDDGSEAFQSLNINSAPVFLHFPPKGQPKKIDHMDIQRLGFFAEVIARWIQERTGVNIHVFRPPYYTGTLAVLVLIGLVACLVYLRRSNLQFLMNKNTWSMLAMFFVLCMLSGQVWNHIRGPPLLQKAANGGVTYIHGSSQAQLVVETYLVLGLYALVVLGLVLLCEAGEQKVDLGLRRTQAVTGIAMLLVFFSMLLSIFRSKAGGYPYHLLIK